MKRIGTELDLRTLYVFYDADCALCGQCRHWLEDQPQWIDLVFIPYQSPRARELCPLLDQFDPGREMVALGNNGYLYQGSDAWIMCLYALREHRPLAFRLASPELRPLARKLCHLISKNRLRLSALFGGRRDEKDIAHEIAATADEACESEACSVSVSP